MAIFSLVPTWPFLQVKRWSQQGDPGHHCLLQGEGEAGGVTRRVSVGQPPTVLHLLSNLGTGLCYRWGPIILKAPLGLSSTGRDKRCVGVVCPWEGTVTNVFVSFDSCQPAGRPRLQVTPHSPQRPPILTAGPHCNPQPLRVYSIPCLSLGFHCVGMLSHLKQKAWQRWG